MNLSLLAGFFRVLTIFTKDPVFGDKGAVLNKVLSLAALAAERGEAGRHDFEKLCADLDVMVAQGREPTKDEWDALLSRSDAAHAILQKEVEPAPTDSEGGVPD